MDVPLDSFDLQIRNVTQLAISKPLFRPEGRRLIRRNLQRPGLPIRPGTLFGFHRG
jgi:hypothetical protein